MTWTTPDEPLTRESVEVQRSAHATRVRRTLAGAALGAVVLGTAAGLLAAVRDGSVSASAQVVTAADPPAVDSGPTGGDPATRTTTFIETELVYLRGADFTDQVAASVGTPSPELEAEQVGETSVITITATAADAESAVATAQAAADLYIDRRRQQLTDRIADQVAAVEAQIGETESALADMGGPPEAGELDTQERQRDALAARYAEQLAVRDSLERAAADAPEVAGLLQSATVPPPGLVSGSALLVLLGIVAGALIGAAAPLVLASLGGRIRDEADLRDVDAPVLSPPLPGPRTAGRHPDLLEQAVQLQALRMANGPVARGSLAVLAPTAGVGASFTAVQHARHAARRGPTLLVCSDERNDSLAELGVDPRQLPTVPFDAADERPLSGEALIATARPTPVPDLYVIRSGPRPRGDRMSAARTGTAELVAAAAAAGWGLVVDTPPLDRSDLGVQTARDCAETLLVAGVGRSTLDDVERSLAALRVADVELTGIVLAHPVRRSRTRREDPTSIDGRNPAAHRKQPQRA